MTTQEQYCFPASYAQQRLWLLDRLEPGNVGYNVATAYFIEGDLNFTALHKSINEIVRRHETLRTRFGEAEGVPVQIINAKQVLKLECEEVRTREEAEVRAREEARRGFDLEKGPLIRAMLLKINDREHLLVIMMHHIISDGWSLGVFYKELAALYEVYCHGKESPLAELEIQYADYADWQRNWLSGDVLERQMKYWTEQLEGAPPVIDLLTDLPRGEGGRKESGTVRFAISEEVSGALKRLSREEGATLFMALFGAFNTLLYRYSGQKDIVIGTPIANRNQAEIEELIGYFANTLVMRTRLDGDPTFRELLRRVKDVAMGAYANQDVPFEKLVEELHPARDLSHIPIFQVLFILQNAPRDPLKLANLKVSGFAVETGAARVSLEFMLGDLPQGFGGRVEYDSEQFAQATIEGMTGHFVILLESIAANPDKRISELDILSKQEQEQILAEWNQTTSDYPGHACFHELFEKQAEKTPESIAVVFEDKSVPYAELNRKANQLANYLIKESVGPETIVAICLDRSVEMLIALLAVLKAGGAYLPLDPGYPKDRLALMIENSRAGLVLTEQRLLEALPAGERKTICVDKWGDKLAGESVSNPTTRVREENLAYVIYTSGSTGVPKGVAIEQRGLTNFLYAMLEQPGLTVDDVLLAITPLSFDITGLDLFLPLIVGARVVILNREMSTDTARLIEQLNTHDITVLQTTPVRWRMLVEAGWDKSPRLKILCGGEALREAQARELRERGASLWNLYGPTETTVWCTVEKVEEAEVSIGRPIANTQVFLLDQNLRPVPIGVAGELWVSGAGLARGYSNRPDLTAERFVPNPYGSRPGERMYRTGDLARWTPDGKILCIGRTDYQVKIRGHRIETGEIEQVMKALDGVSHAVVVATAEEEKRLVAYFVEEEGTSVVEAELKQQIRRKLPEYMIPSVIMKLDKMPLTPTGKIDRKALPAPNARTTAEAIFVEPRTPIEETLASIWKELLCLDNVSVFDNFFDLDGHSLLAASLISKVRKELNVEVPLQVFFRRATIAELSEAVEEIQKSGAGIKLPGIFRLPRESNGGRGDVDRLPAFVEREEGSLGD